MKIDVKWSFKRSKLPNYFQLKGSINCFYHIGEFNTGGVGEGQEFIIIIKARHLMQRLLLSLKTFSFLYHAILPKTSHFACVVTLQRNAFLSDAKWHSLGLEMKLRKNSTKNGWNWVYQLQWGPGTCILVIFLPHACPLFSEKEV